MSAPLTARRETGGSGCMGNRAKGPEEIGCHPCKRLRHVETQCPSKFNRGTRSRIVKAWGRREKKSLWDRGKPTSG